PVNAMVCGLFGASSVMVSVAVLEPVAAGANVTFTVAVWPAGIVNGAGFGVVVKPKSEALAPLIAMVVTCMSAVPVLVMVSGMGLLVEPVFWLPNAAVVGEMLKAGAVAVPVMPTVCGLPVALSVKFS